MKEIKSILLINEAYSDNIGDHAINDGIVKVLKDIGVHVNFSGFSGSSKVAGSGVNLSLSSNYLNLLKKSIVIKSFYWIVKNIRRLFVACTKCDGIAIIGGGQLLMEKSSFSIALFSWVVMLRLFGNKVFLLSVGVGENFNFYEKTLFKISFSLCEDIFVREEKGKSLLCNLFSVNAKVSPDAAYALFESSINVNEQRDKIFCAFITDFNVYKRYEKEMSSDDISINEYYNKMYCLIDEYRALGYEIVYSWTTVSDKLETLKYQKYYGETIDDNVCNIDATCVDDLLVLFSRVSTIFSGRMHALILGHISNCKLEPFVLSKKIQMFVDEYMPKDPAYLQLELNKIINGFIGVERTKS